MVDIRQFYFVYQGCAAHHIGIALCEFAVAFLRPVGTPYRLYLVSSERESKFTMVHGYIAAKGIVEVVFQCPFCDAFCIFPPEESFFRNLPWPAIPFPGCRGHCSGILKMSLSPSSPYLPIKVSRFPWPEFPAVESCNAQTYFFIVKKIYVRFLTVSAENHGFLAVWMVYSFMIVKCFFKIHSQTCR